MKDLERLYARQADLDRALAIFRSKPFREQDKLVVNLLMSVRGERLEQIQAAQSSARDSTP